MSDAKDLLDSDMLTIRDHRTSDLFDPWAHLGPHRRRLLDRSWAGVFRDHLLQHVPVKELASRFRDSFGRPSKDLHVVLGALILQQLHDLTDAAAVEAIAFNIAWHYALDIQTESDSYVCERTLRNYRRLVMEDGLDEVLFQTLTDQLIRKLKIDTGRQRIDSTAVRSAMRTLTRLGIVVETISKFLRELSRKQPDLYSTVDRDVVRLYVERRGEDCFEFAKPSESKRRLPESLTVLYGLVQQFASTAAADLPSYTLLAQVLEEQCDLSEDPDAEEKVSVKDPSKIPCDSVQNPGDPDASYNAHRGQGYSVQVMETYTDEADEQDDQPDIITHVAVNKMTVHDSNALQPAFDDASERDVKPSVVLGDSHYGAIDKAFNEQEVELLARAMPPKGRKQNRLTLEQFDLDESGRIRFCPAGQAPIACTVGRTRFEVRFDPELCNACHLRKLCPVRSTAQNCEKLRWQYTHDRVRQRARRLEQQTEAFKERYRWRAGIEATMCRLKHQMRLASLRVRGRAAVKYATFLRALGLNIRRVAACRAH